MNREVRGATRKAKEKYKNRVETKFSSGSLHAAWQGVKNMAAVNKNSGSGRSKFSL